MLGFKERGKSGDRGLEREIECVRNRERYLSLGVWRIIEEEREIRHYGFRERVGKKDIGG